MTPWYPLAGQVVEPVVHLGAVGMGSPSTPLCHIGFLGLGSWALRAVLLEWAVWWPWGDSPGPVHGREGVGIRGSSNLTLVDRNVQHATAVNP